MWSGSRLLIRTHFGWSRNVSRTSRILPGATSTSRLLSIQQQLAPLSTKADQEEEHKKADEDDSIRRRIGKQKNKDEESRLTKTQKLMKQIKKAGLAGIISYGFWEVAFWSASVPVVIVTYQQLTGHWPDLTDKEEVAKLTAEAFVYVNLSRFTVPLRIGLALSITPWVQKNIVDRFIRREKKKDSTHNKSE